MGNMTGSGESLFSTFWRSFRKCVRGRYTSLHVPGLDMEPRSLPWHCSECASINSVHGNFRWQWRLWDVVGARWFQQRFQVQWVPAGCSGNLPETEERFLVLQWACTWGGYGWEAALLMHKVGLWLVCLVTLSLPTLWPFYSRCLVIISSIILYMMYHWCRSVSAQAKRLIVNYTAHAVVLTKILSQPLCQNV